ncbi:MAG: stage sporulation protein [Caldanaerobacter sp.]|uniref:peptidoglycan-binding protein n=1 Tax=Caldanaerobacter sp. TaxID=2930036 RepID=UPI0024AB4521|nr:peptidoglycan-binding protein [Caldanaerobacter sp.]MDI3518015.1 stage sporulation protein [Caldanaerobacter sp.]
MEKKKVAVFLLSSSLVLSMANTAYAATILKYGMRSPEVRKLQENLNRLGYFVTSTPTDYFGPATLNALIKFQKDSNLVPDGIYGPSTEKVLLEKLNAFSGKNVSSPPQTSNTSNSSATQTVAQATFSRTLRYGMQGEDVKFLQSILNKLGFDVGTPDGIFGFKTQNAVVQFQKANGLVADGIVGPATQKVLLQKVNASSPSRGDEKREEVQTTLPSSSNGSGKGISNGDGNAIFNKVLKYGMIGEEVKLLQQYLNKLGFDAGVPDGIFGGKTRQAVINFQKSANLEADGIVGPMTWQALISRLNVTLPSRGDVNRDNPQNQKEDQIQFPTPFTRELKGGLQGDDVKLLQGMLSELKYYDGDVTGTYDDVTSNAVRSFQQYYSLNPTGIADVDTLKKLLEVDAQVKAVKGFYVQGKGGYGHGVGMTQFGAKGMAEQGFKYDEIIKYYYTGVDINKVDTSNVNVKVKISLDVTSQDIKITSSQPYNVIYKVKDDSTGQIIEKQETFLPDSVTSINYLDGNILIANSQSPEIRTSVDMVKIVPTNDGVLFYVNKARPYEGEFRIYPNPNSIPSGLDLINVLPIEEYLRGVVPAEMSPSWPEEALKAQILAARTYALVRIKDENIFDVYDTTLSQVYKGISIADPKIDQLIESTKGEVVTYGGKLADTVYSASAGGYTVDSFFAWKKDVPYLKGKPDPYDTSKYATYWWNVSISRSQIEKAYPQIGAVLNVEITKKMFDRPVEIKITGTKGIITVGNDDFRKAIEDAAGQKLFASEYFDIVIQN